MKFRCFIVESTAGGVGYELLYLFLPLNLIIVCRSRLSLYKPLYVPTSTVFILFVRPSPSSVPQVYTARDKVLIVVSSHIYSQVGCHK